jgi:hypothetical protein
LILVIALVFWHSNLWYSLIGGSNRCVIELGITIGPDASLGWRLIDLEELLQLRVLFGFFSLSLEIVFLPLRSVLVACRSALLKFLLPPGLW